MATQLSGLIRLRRSPFFSTIDSQKSEHDTTRGISRATIHLVDGRDESAACGAELVLKFVDVARDTTLYSFSPGFRICHWFYMIPSH